MEILCFQHKIFCLSYSDFFFLSSSLFNWPISMLKKLLRIDVICKNTLGIYTVIILNSRILLYAKIWDPAFYGIFLPTDRFAISLPQRLLNIFTGVTVDCLRSFPSVQDLSTLASAALPVPAGPASQRLTDDWMGIFYMIVQTIASRWLDWSVESFIIHQLLSRPQKPCPDLWPGFQGRTRFSEFSILCPGWVFLNLVLP